MNQQITLLSKKGLSLRSTARILCISVTTLLKLITSIGEGIEHIAIGKIYEVAEMMTYIGKNAR